MKLEHLKRVQKLRLTDKKLLQTLGSQDDKFIEVYLDLISYFPIKSEKGNLNIETLDWLIRLNSPQKIEKLIVLRDILGCFFPRNEYELNHIICYFISPILSEDFDIIKYKEDMISLCKKEGFVKNIMDTSYTYYICNILETLASNDLHRRNIAFDANLIVKGLKTHQLAFAYYEDLEEVAKESESNEKVEDILTFVERISRDYTMITMCDVADKRYYQIIKHYQKEFMDDACFNKILSNQEVLANRNSRELLSLAQYYAKYKTDHMERVMFILTNSTLLRLRMYYQNYLFEYYQEMSCQEFNTFMNVITFILEKFAILVSNDDLLSILNYFLSDPKNPLTISALLQYGWTVEALEQYLEENHLESFDFDDEIRIYHYSSKK